MIVGLGNPGRQYEESKHNTGFRVVDELAKRWNVTLWQDKMDALVAQTTVNGEKIILVKPQTYMNESGRAVGPLMRWYKIDQPMSTSPMTIWTWPSAVCASARAAAMADITASRACLPTAVPISPVSASHRPALAAP